MRHFLLFTLILAVKNLGACGFFPYGEDTRISIFNPRSFGYYQYTEFNYSSNSFGSYYSDTLVFPTNYVEPNTQLWFEYCRGKVDLPSVQEAVYKLSEVEIDGDSKNAMIRYLYSQKDKDALNYLRFAKNCEFFNSWQEDPWERQSFSSMPKRTELMNKAMALANKVKNKELKKRYTFLAIRLAWYNHHYDQVKLLFNGTFETTNNKDILYYWSLYFKSFTETDQALANFELAQVFAHAVDKRFVCHQYFHKKVPVEQALRYAKSDEEKANVYLLAGIERYDKTLPYIQKMYEYQPSSDGLSFLLLREINKIEDFVLTPYYTLFEPSLSYDPWKEETEAPLNQVLKRAERDRLYAKEVLQFVNKVDLGKVNNPLFWQCCKAYLQFISRDYDECLALIARLEKSLPAPALLHQVKMIKALALTASQTLGKAVISAGIQSTLMNNQNNGQFIFAIGKELEYLGNTTDAALLYSKLTRIWYEANETGNQVVYWKCHKKGRNSKYHGAYFTDYFDYTDVVYSPEQVQHLINEVQKHQDDRDSFSVFRYEALKTELPRLYDLLGTKYIRQNKLENALMAFEQAGDPYWNRAYTTWEDLGNIFDQNPFYQLKYTPQFIVTRDTIRLNKVTVTKQLIHYLHKAEDQQEKDRDYYYFLVANAYFNMGREGNIWMMRRFSQWSAYSLSAIEDEAEFRQSNLAKQYYLLAKQYARTNQFKALCLRMVIRCEKHKIEYRYVEDWQHHDLDYDSLMATNKYYLELKRNYGDYFDELVSNCDYFDRYFEGRR